VKEGWYSMTKKKRQTGSDLPAFKKKKKAQGPRKEGGVCPRGSVTKRQSDFRGFTERLLMREGARKGENEIQTPQPQRPQRGRGEKKGRPSSKAKLTHGFRRGHTFRGVNGTWKLARERKTGTTTQGGGERNYKG